MLYAADESARILELDAVIVHTDGGVHGGKEIGVRFQVDQAFPEGVELGFIVGSKAVRTGGEGRGGLGRAVGGAPLQGRMGYLSFRRFRLRAMGTDGLARCRRKVMNIGPSGW